MSTRKWPKRFPADYILEHLELAPDSPSGLKWKKSPNAWVTIGQFAGTRVQGGWILRIEGYSYKCDHVILLMNGQYPQDGQVCTHIDGDAFNNDINNIQWVHRSDKAYRRRINFKIANASAAYERERDNLEVIREWLKVDPDSPTGLSWRKGKRKVNAGTAAGCLMPMTNEYRVTLDSVSYSVARLVLWLTGQPAKPGEVVVHLNGQRTDNSPMNLKWMHRSELARQNGISTSKAYRYVLLDSGRFVARYRYVDEQGIRVYVCVGEFDSAIEAEAAAIQHQIQNHGRIF